MQLFSQIRLICEWKRMKSSRKEYLHKNHIIEHEEKAFLIKIPPMMSFVLRLCASRMGLLWSLGLNVHFFYSKNLTFSLCSLCAWMKTSTPSVRADAQREEYYVTPRADRDAIPLLCLIWNCKGEMFGNGREICRSRQVLPFRTLPAILPAERGAVPWLTEMRCARWTRMLRAHAATFALSLAASQRSEFSAGTERSPPPPLPPRSPVGRAAQEAPADNLTLWHMIGKRGWVIGGFVKDRDAPKRWDGSEEVVYESVKRSSWAHPDCNRKTWSGLQRPGFKWKNKHTCGEIEKVNFRLFPQTNTQTLV